MFYLEDNLNSDRGKRYAGRVLGFIENNNYEYPEFVELCREAGVAFPSEEGKGDEE